METLRREPFRLLFPLGVLLAWLAVLPWVLFGSGFIRTWLGTYHALAMTQGFLVAIAAGFLGTMIPRRTGAAPLSALELLLCAGGLTSVPVALVLGRVALAEAAYLMVLGTLAQFALRRMRRATRPPPPSFVLLPIGVLAAVVGAGLVIWGVSGGPPLPLALGRSLVEEGLLLSMILALAPMLTPLICHGAAGPEPEPAQARRSRIGAVCTGAALCASFVVQHTLSEPAGLLVRGAVVADFLILGAGAHRPPSVPGLHRRVFWLALWFVPLGLLLAGARPPYRIPLLHLTFIGGFSLLVFAVSLHVVFLHTGRQWLADRWNKPMLAIGVLTLGAALARASAERVTQHYFEALALASSLWLLAAMVWGIYLVALLARRPRGETQP